MFILTLMVRTFSIFVECIAESLWNYISVWNPLLDMFSTKIKLGWGLTKSGGHYPILVMKLSPRNGPNFYIFSHLLIICKPCQSQASTCLFSNNLTMFDYCWNLIWIFFRIYSQQFQKRTCPLFNRFDILFWF